MDDIIRKVLPDGTIQRLKNGEVAEYQPITNPLELERISLEKLSIMLQRCEGDVKYLPVVKEILDRVQGKPVQRSISTDGGGDVARKLDEAIARERAIITQAVVIEGKKEE